MTVLETNILTEKNHIEQILPACTDLINETGSVLPFCNIFLPLVWWNYFNNLDDSFFGKKRGRNHLGSYSKLKKIIVITVESDNKLLGVTPLFSYSVKIPGVKKDINTLSFAVDSALIPYQDFLITSSMREEVINTLLDRIVEEVRVNYDILILDHIPEWSSNLNLLRNNLQKNNEFQYHEFVTSRRGGLWPWTIEPLIINLKELGCLMKSDMGHYDAIQSIVGKLQNLTAEKLLFPGTRRPFENEIRETLAQMDNKVDHIKEYREIKKLLDNYPIKYPNIELPAERESYTESLNKTTRRFFNRYRRKFMEQGGRFLKIDSKNITTKDINDYISLHLLRWGDKSASFNNEKLYAFHFDICRTFADQGKFTLFFALYNEKRIAAQSCFDFFPRREGYFTGRDPEYDDLRAGRLLYMETINDAIDNHFKMYDLGYGEDSYKLQFTKSASKTINLILSGNQEFTDFDNMFVGYECMMAE